MREPGPVLAGWLTREIFHLADDDRPHMIRGRGAPEPFEAGSAADVCLPIYTDADGLRYVDASGAEPEGGGYPRCADCRTGTVEWFEAGHVPGTRRCAACGSYWADSRYSACSGYHLCAAHPRGVSG